MNPKPKHKFPKGNPGRQKGAVNKLTKTVKETVLAVFQEIQDDPKVKLSAFARKYPREFYTIASKLIPAEMNNQISGDISIKIIRE